MLSSHLIDEVSNLIERVLVIDGGRIVMDETADDARGQATNLVGDAGVVEGAVAGYEIIHRETLGRVTSVTILGSLPDDKRAELVEAGVDFAPVSLQQLIVRRTQHHHAASESNISTANTEGVLR